MVIYSESVCVLVIFNLGNYDFVVGVSMPSYLVSISVRC